MSYEVNRREIIARDEIVVVDDAGDSPVKKNWEQKQKEILTNVVDYNLETLESLVRRGQIDLKPKYQRRSRWENSRKSKLIESFLMNIPVPPIFLNEDRYGKYSVIDGKQRLTAISEFLNDKFILAELEIFNELNGKLFSELDEDMRSMLSARPTLRATIILRQSDPDIKFQVFERLNTGGLRLNAQEIRNSTFTGSFNDLVLELSESKEFHSILNIKDKRYSPVYREMKDAELVLRFFTFQNSWENFRGGIKEYLDNFMYDYRHITEATVADYRGFFLQTVRKVDLIFGEYSFRRWNPDSSKWRKPILASLFDTQMIAVTYFDEQVLGDYREEIIEGMKGLFLDEEFQKMINAAIPSYFILRITAVIEMIAEATGHAPHRR